MGLRGFLILRANGYFLLSVLWVLFFWLLFLLHHEVGEGSERLCCEKGAVWSAGLVKGGGAE